MSSGPIEFASDPVVDDKPPTEFGGVAGLMQGGHPDYVMSGGDKRGLIVRAQGVRVVDPVTGLSTVDETANAVDPVTGVAVDPEWNQDGKTVKPVDPLKTGNPDAGVL